MCGLRESKKSSLISRTPAWVTEWPSFLRTFNGFSLKGINMFEIFVGYTKWKYPLKRLNKQIESWRAFATEWIVKYGHDSSVSVRVFKEGRKGEEKKGQAVRKESERRGFWSHQQISEKVEGRFFKREKEKKISANGFPSQHKYSVYSLIVYLCEGLPEINKGPTCSCVRPTISTENKLLALDTADSRPLSIKHKWVIIGYVWNLFPHT